MLSHQPCTISNKTTTIQVSQCDCFNREFLSDCSISVFKILYVGLQAISKGNPWNSSKSSTAVICAILLQNGSKMHFYLGELVKKRYTVENNMLSPNYTRDEVYVRSTDYDRTLMSVLSQLSAIFPPDEDQVSSVFNKYSYIYSSCERMQNGQSEIVKTKVVAKKWLCDSKKDLWYFFEFVFTHPRICTTFYQFFCHQSTISTTLGHHLRFHVYFTLFFLHGECLW